MRLGSRVAARPNRRSTEFSVAVASSSSSSSSSSPSSSAPASSSAAAPAPTSVFALEDVARAEALGADEERLLLLVRTATGRRLGSVLHAAVREPGDRDDLVAALLEHRRGSSANEPNERLQVRELSAVDVNEWRWRARLVAVVNARHARRSLLVSDHSTLLATTIDHVAWHCSWRQAPT